MVSKIIERSRKKTLMIPRSDKQNDRCTVCKKKYVYYPFKIIYKDVVECGYCGRIFLIQDHDDLLKYG